MSSTRTGTTRQQISFNLVELLQQFLSERQAAGTSPITLRAYRRLLSDLRIFLLQDKGTDDIRDCGKEQIQRFAAHLKQIPVARLCVFFRWVTVNGFILADPTATLVVRATKEKTFPKYLRQDEINDLLDSIRTDSDAGLRDRTMMELLYSCGLRAGEVRRLTLADINFADASVRILMSKGKKDRIVPIGRTALNWLDRYVQSVHGYHFSGPLFYHLSTRNLLATNYLQSIIEKHRINAGIKKRCHPRIFRHSFAVHLLENGASIRHIQAMMGHSDLKTTQRYTQIIPAELKRAHMRAHPSENRKWKLPQAEPTRLCQVKRSKIEAEK